MKKNHLYIAIGLATLPLMSTPLIAQSSHSVASQATIKMGDGTIAGSAFQPYDNVWLYTVTTPDGKVSPQGLWSDHMQKTTVDGKAALLRVQGMTFVNGKTSSTINVFDPLTLAPFSGRQQGIEGEVQSRVFKGRHVVVTRRNPAGVETKSEADLPTVPYDFNGGMYGMILVGLPLRAGLDGTFDSVEEFDERPSVESFKVIDREEVGAGVRGNVTAWKVLVERPGQYKMTFWLTKVPPYIIKLQYSMASRPEVWNWNMI